MSITQQQAIEALDGMMERAAIVFIDGRLMGPRDILRQYIEQVAGAAPEADVVLVPRKILEACSESLGSFCSDHGWAQADMDNMDALNGLLAVQHPQQEQSK